MRDEETEERVDHFALSFGTLIDWAQEHGYPPSACAALRSALAAVREAEGERLTPHEAKLILAVEYGEGEGFTREESNVYRSGMRKVEAIAALAAVREAEPPSIPSSEATLLKLAENPGLTVRLTPEQAARVAEIQAAADGVREADAKKVLAHVVAVVDELKAMDNQAGLGSPTLDYLWDECRSIAAREVEGG